VINQSTAIVRILKQYFDQHFGLNVWGNGVVTHVGQQEDDLQEYVAYESSFNGKRFSLRAIAPEDEPPLGRIEFNSGSSQFDGPLSLDTLERVRAHLIGEAV
jgi:hypothetical protein